MSTIFDFQCKHSKSHHETTHYFNLLNAESVYWKNVFIDWSCLSHLNQSAFQILQPIFTKNKTFQQEIIKN